MKNSLRYILLLVISVCSLRAAAVDPYPVDTLYFYDTWDQMLELTPVAMVENPFFYAPSPHMVFLETGDENLDEKLWQEHIAISLGDSIWLMSAYYIKTNFKGDVRNLDGYVPVFFNDKAAYLTQSGRLGVKDLLFGTVDDYEHGIQSFEYYNIDFINHEVKRVTPEILSQLLERYHNLQMRYEGMRDYKKHEIIEDYYFKYIDMVTQDIMYPFIVDLVETSPHE